MSAASGRRLRRWGVFNAVGVLGFGLQLGVLFALKHELSMNYLVATALAVESAVLHNFVWHEHVTWADVIAPFRHGVWMRLLRFHVANGVISIIGNLAFTWALVEVLQWSYLAANIASVLICSLLNFFASDRLVFRSGELNKNC
jgi:putative flippase GtrA